MDRRFHIGIDVGGTNTDAAVLRRDRQASSYPDKGLVASFKTQTTANVTDGIALAVQQVLQTGNIAATEIAAVSVGTTHFVNAVIECDARRLAKVAVLRLAYPYTQQCPPFIDFPPRLRKLMEGHVAILHGGLQVDGSEINAIRRDEIVRECAIIKSKGIKNVVVVGVFSPVAQESSQEHGAKSIILEALGEGNVNVVCSSDVGTIGLLERENAAILNASMLTFAQRTIASYRAVMARLGIRCPLLLTQFDGTMLAASKAAQIPVRTFSNGPTNSMRGAAYLSGTASQSLIVVDVGGTTSDAGVLLPSGFPRQAAAFTESQLRSFSMPDIQSIGLGGGSRVRFHDDGRVTVGPDSVGSALLSAAIAFGGSDLTTTDVAFAAGLCEPFANADVSLVSSRLSKVQIDAAVNEIRRKFAALVDKVKTSAGDAEVLLVGGGSVIVPPTIPGVARLVKPTHHDVANAVGAAVARVAGEVSCVEILENRSLSSVLEPIKERAINAAEDLGARKGEVQVAEVTCIQLPYVSNRATRIVVRAVGDLDPEGNFVAEDLLSPELAPDETAATRAEGDKDASPDEKVKVDAASYRPAITPAGEWLVSETDLEFFADGCAILGCGGGGTPYPAFLQARELLRNGGRIRIVDDSYFGNREDVRILPCGFMGSPSVSSERLPSGTEITSAAKKLLEFMGLSGVDAIISDEIGGGNGIEPMIVASSKNLDIPLVDGDLMGRAFPHMHQVLPCVYLDGILCPCAIADGVGNTTIVPSTTHNANVEHILRAVCTALGSKAGSCMRPLLLDQFRKYGITRSTSQAWRIGRAVAICREEKRISQVAAAILSVQNGKLLFVGKIMEVTREVRGGFTYGEVQISSLRQDEVEFAANHDVGVDGTTLVIPFQNENLAAIRRSASGKSDILCTVPDLIAVLDSQSGASIGTQDYRYGLRVTVVAMAGHPSWTTPEGLLIGGPHAFRSVISTYKPIGAYKEPQSVIKEYGG
ncbi:DUF917-domain-containing protein [Exidia glandulosa HHB12029]|uniref:DUF917-domain-containing protein n=1 Tax=Exidia glandulosa HHB12029 TaxID=1314781 RepID=A0A165CBJ7_EXIGL|nr:DUF917-domain-containing protein [Exidia glandulosa HHB12029]